LFEGRKERGRGTQIIKRTEKGEEKRDHICK
jgi:hypothetical protein